MHPRRVAFLFLLAGSIGALSGIASGLFLELLRVATETREAHQWLIFLLPVAGAIIAWVYQGYGQSAAGGNNLILDQIHEPLGAGVPLRMFPLILASTVATHLFGGSAGREGTAVQMGGSIAGEIGRRLRLSPGNTRLALMCGISGGFSSVFGTPLAGTVFGMEMLAIGGFRYDALLPCLIAALIGNEAVHLLGVAHTDYHVATVIPALEPSVVLKVAVAAVAFGLASAVFSEMTAEIEHISKRYLRNPVVRTASGGVIVVFITLALGTQMYNGLSLPMLRDAITGDVPTWAFLIKLVLTAITLGFGFKGGEVTPLFVIGACLGATLAGPLGMSPELLAALGFVAVFAAAANTPIACVLMGAELFGGNGIIYTGIAVFIAYTISGHRGIYHAQRIVSPKFAQSRPDGSDNVTLRDLRRRQ